MKYLTFEQHIAGQFHFEICSKTSMDKYTMLGFCCIIHIEQCSKNLWLRVETLPQEMIRQSEQKSINTVSHRFSIKKIISIAEGNI